MKAADRSVLLIATWLLGFTVPRGAWAQGTAAAAEALFEQGRSEMEAGNFESACGKFRESDQLDPAPGTKFNLGDCEEQRGNFATAWELFKAVEDNVDPSDERYAIAQQRREAVEPKVPKLVIDLAEGSPPNTTVRIGDAELGPSSFGVPLPLDPGDHELVVSAPGRRDMRFTATLTEGSVLKLSVSPGKPNEPAPVEAPASSTSTSTATSEVDVRDQPTSSGGDPTLGYVIGGVGVAGLALGTVTGIMALGKAKTADEHCWDSPAQGCDQEGADANRSGKPLATVSTVGFVVGAVGVGVGAYFLLSSDDHGGAETALVTRGSALGAEVSLVHRF